MRVLFSCTASDGHFLPLVPLAQSFASAGHEVAFATAAAFAPRVNGEGFELLPAGQSLAELQAAMAPFRARLDKLPPDDRRPYGFAWRFATVDAPAKVDQLLTEMTAWQPELVVHETADLAAPAVAAALGLPSAQHSFGRLLPPACVERAAPATAELWRRLGLEPDPASGLFRGPYIDIWPASLQDNAPPEGTAVEHLRPVTITSGDPAWEAHLDGGRPTVYVTLGTVFNDLSLFRIMLDALADLDCSVLATVGRNNDPGALDPIPENAIVERYVRQADVLPFCDVAVGHGGSGSTLAALAHALPMLLVPQAADQFENAAACAAGGAAICLHPDAVTTDNVRAAVHALLDDPAPRAVAASVAREIASMPSPADVVAGLTAYATSTRPLS
jgi:UDP:flavonoid glycosyltransferase YjiC (YdhE family)